MRVGLVRNVGLSITALAVLALGGCNDNPLSFDVKDTVGIQVNPSEMVVAAGRTADLESRAVNQGNEPTFDAVSAAVDASCGQGAITVEPDPDALEIQPPGLYEVTGGAVLGQSCITLTSGSNTATVEVTVVTDAIEITAPDNGTIYRAGDTGQVTAQLIDVDGNPVGPYAVEDAVFTSSNEDAIAYTDEVGSFTAVTTGSSTLTVVWSGQDANGTAGIGVIRQADITVEVAAGVPAAAAFASAIPGLGAGEETTVEVIVSDAEGNQNTNADEITGCTVLSADLLVATATCAVVAGAEPTDPVRVDVTVASVGPGTSEISGTVLTAGGALPYGPATATVIAPSLTGLSAASGGFGSTVTISGIGLAAEGFATLVFVDDEQLGNFTVVSDTEITAQMPTYAQAAAGLPVVVTVDGIPTTEAITWEQTDACNANDFAPVAGYDGPIVAASIPLRCDGTASDGTVGDTWFNAVISVDALGGNAAASVNYAPTWGPPLKDIDWFYCGDAGTAGPPWASCVFEIDQPPATVDLDLGAGDHVFLMDDYAFWNAGDVTVQDYTLEVTIN